jgi:cytochrome c oxidase subunit 2
MLGSDHSVAEASEALVRKGKQLWATCAACHGAKGEGNAMMKAPPLLSKDGWYLKSQLKKFKEGIRGKHPKDLTGMQMQSMSMVLANEAAIDAVIAFLKEQPVPKPKHKLKGDLELGKTLYMSCQACHGSKGEGKKVLNSPALSHLPDWYVVAQLKKFKMNIRGAHKSDITGRQMVPMAKMLKDEKAMKDVAAYIATLGE